MITPPPDAGPQREQTRSRPHAPRRASTRRARPRSRRSRRRPGGRIAPACRSSSTKSCSGMLTEPSDLAGTPVDHRRDPEPDCCDAGSSASGSIAATIASSSSSCELVGVGTSCCSCSVPSASIEPVADLRAAEIDADDSLGAHGTRLPYRPGWRTEKSPTGSTRAAAHGERCQRRRARSAADGARRAPKQPAGPAGDAGSGSPCSRSACCSSSGSSPATSPSAAASRTRTRGCRRRRKSNLAPQDGLLISKPSLIMLLGTDGDKTACARTHAARTRSCSSAPIRSRHRMAYLSIPRDLRVDIPGQERTRSTPPSSSAARR